MRRFLSTALAAVIAISVLSIGMVNVTSAAAETPDVAWNFSDSEVISTVTTGETPIVGTSPSGKITDSASLAGTALSGIKITSSNMDCTNLADSYYSGTLTKRLQLQGTPQGWDSSNDKIPTQRAFKFTTTGPATLKVYYKVTAGRPLTVYGGTMEAALTDTSTGSPQIGIFSLPSADTYYIYSGNSGMDLWAVTLNYISGDLKEGIITYTSTENGTVKITKDDGTEVNSGTSVPGGTLLTLTATPSEGYEAKVTKDGAEIPLSNNTYKFTVNGDTTINVVFSVHIDRTPITENVIYDARGGSMPAGNLVLKNGDTATGNYYFDLAASTALNENGIIDLGKGADGTQKCIIFSTGDLTGKTAKLVVSFASGGNVARVLEVGSFKQEKGSIDKEIGTSAATQNVYTVSESYTLASNTKYYITSKENTIHVNMIQITVAEEGKTPELLTTTEQNTNGTYDRYAPTSDGTGTYIIHPVTAEDLQNDGENLVITGTDISTPSVYKSVTLGDELIEATALGGEYLFAIVVEGANGAGPAHKLNWDISASPAA